MPYYLGLTGNIACGKSTVGQILQALGAYRYIDADAIVHDLYLSGQPLVADLAQEFGSEILDASGGIDRKALGALVFGDSEKLRRLEALVHPAVQEAIVGQIRLIPDGQVGVLDAIKLIESGYASLCHGLWIVRCSPETQLRRLIEQRGMSEEEALARLAAQPPIEPKLAQATEIIDNDGSLDDLQRQVTAAWGRFQESLPPQDEEYQEGGDPS
ncbi:MAG TPA: dephospho-CoA kinase [Ktedonobacterales bacterium]